MSALDEDVKAVSEAVAFLLDWGSDVGNAAALDLGEDAQAALSRLRSDIDRLRSLAQDALEHPNYTPEPGDERLE